MLMMLLLHILLFLAHAAVPCFSKIVKVEDTDIFEKIQFYLVSREWERPESERREEFRISEWDVSSVTDFALQLPDDYRALARIWDND